MRSEKIKHLEEERDSLRKEWRTVREERLALRDRLLEKGLSKREVRRARDVKIKKKEQDRLATLIKHLDRRISMLRNREENREE